jgi:tetratricopeptide (TPR) repeat protein
VKQFAACRMWLVTNGFASPGRQWLPCLGVLAGIILTVCGFSGCGRREFRTDAQLVADANRDLKLGQFDLAIQTADAVSESSEHWGKAQLIAGEARMRSGDLQAALVCYLRVAEQVPDRTQAATATFAAGEIHREFGRLHDAQRLYRRVLAASRIAGSHS